MPVLTGSSPPTPRHHHLPILSASYNPRRITRPNHSCRPYPLFRSTPPAPCVHLPPPAAPPSHPTNAHLPSHILYTTPPSGKSLPPSFLPPTPTFDEIVLDLHHQHVVETHQEYVAAASRPDSHTLSSSAALDLDFTSLTKHRVEGDAPRAPGQHLLPILLAVDHHHRRTCEISLGLHYSVHSGPDLEPATQHQQQWKRCPEHCRIRGSYLATRARGQARYSDFDTTRGTRLQFAAGRRTIIPETGSWLQCVYW